MPTVLVTGASKGIGAAIARRLARDGFDVLVHYHADAAGAKRTVAAVRKVRRKAEALQADLGDEAQVRRLAAAVARLAPRLQGVVHNAGVYDRKGLGKTDGAAWKATRAVDLDAPALLTHELLPNLADGASLVFVSSIVAVRGSAHGAAYATAKAGLLGLTRALALELAPRRVRVNAVAPGYIDTAILAGDSPARRKARVAEVPLGRIGTPADVAGAVSFLVGPDAAYVTGTTLHINGGLWMG